MWKIGALFALALLAELGTPIGSVTAQTVQPAPPTTQPPAPAPFPTAKKPTQRASLHKRKTRHAARHSRRRHVAAFKCFGHQWRPFPTRDPNGYFYTPPGGGIC